MNIKKHTAFSYIVVFTLTTLSSLAEETIFIKAHQFKNNIKLFIENNSKETVFFGNPEKCGAAISVKADTFEGGLEYFPKSSEPPWKHIVVLTPKSELEDMPHNWSWSFNIPLEKDIIVRKLKIFLWVSNEKNFKESTLTSLQLKEFSAIVQTKE